METEKCKLCDKDTGIPKRLDIDDPGRLGYYVECAGQLCRECYHNVYVRPDIYIFQTTTIQ
jgi:hypothetical protein